MKVGASATVPHDKPLPPLNRNVLLLDGASRSALVCRTAVTTEKD
jgi:hypothetical protein